MELYHDSRIFFDETTHSYLLDGERLLITYRLIDRPPKRLIGRHGIGKLCHGFQKLDVFGWHCQRRKRHAAAVVPEALGGIDHAEMAHRGPLHH